MSVSVLILTKNEEKDLPSCLQSVAWCDDIHLYDSFSDDRTVEVAKAFGATVVQRKFDNWSAHQNWGLANVRFKHPWVFYIDADERMTPELAESIKRIAEQPGANVAFQVQRRDFFMGTWLKHVQSTAHYIRLFRPEHITYERLVNPVTLVNGSTGRVTGYLDHFPFSKGIEHWLARHNSYSTFEARQIVENRRVDAAFSLRKAFFSKDFHERRYHQKEFFYRLPLRPLVKFLILYVGKRGFLDGKAGLTYATLQAIYEYFIVLKTREIFSQTRAR